MVMEYGILLAHDLTNNYPMKTNKYIMVDLMLLSLTIALMILFNVVFYPTNQSESLGNTDQIFKETLTSMNTGNPDLALISCNKALSVDSSNAKGYYLRALINTQLDRKTDAIKDYSMALKLNPDFFQVYLNRGLLSMKEKQSLKALLDFISAIKINPLKSFWFLISRSFKSIF
jgi:tetratricopeptide (TPR) repeat protein